MSGHFFSDSNFSDLEVLSKYVKRVTNDIQDLTIRYEQVLKEKEQLQRALTETGDKVDREKRKQEKLRRKISETEEILKSKANTRAQQVDEQFAQQMKCFHDDSDTKQFIIQLQMRLLAAHEENEKLMRHIVMQMLEKFDQSTNRENGEMFKLSQKLMSHSEEIKQFRECNYYDPAEADCPHAERHQEELRDLKYWTEALKTRYDIAVQERKKTLQKCEDLTQEQSELADDLLQMKIELRQIEREKEDLKTSCRELEETAATYRKQHEADKEEINEALKKRDQATRDLDEASRRYKEDLEFKERKIRQQTEDERTFEQQCRKTKAELSRVRIQLQETLQANEDLSTRVGALQSQCSQEESEVQSSEHEPEGEEPNNSPQHEPETSTFQFSCLKTRKTNEMVHSIKRRVWSDQDTERVAWPVLRKSASLDTLLSELFPAFRDLPSETKNKFSLDRLRPKQALPYETILGMYPQHGFVCSHSPPFGRSCQTTGGRTRAMSEVITSEMEKRCRFDGLGGKSEENKDKLSEEERERKAETEECANETFRSRSGAMARRNAKRFTQESQELFH